MACPYNAGHPQFSRSGGIITFDWVEKNGQTTPRMGHPPVLHNKLPRNGRPCHPRDEGANSTNRGLAPSASLRSLRR